MKILIFLHGTTIMHKNAAKASREKRVKQVEESESSVHDYASYIPVEKAVEKLKGWQSQGAEIIYLSSHEDISNVNKDKTVLEKYKFPKGEILWRKDGKEYKDIIEEINPDIFIEDDCESIGGVKEMTITYVSLDIKRRIKSIPVKEFGGIDHLPDNITELERY